MVVRAGLVTRTRAVRVESVALVPVFLGGTVGAGPACRFVGLLIHPAGLVLDVGASP